MANAATDNNIDKQVVIKFFEQAYNKQNYQYVLEHFKRDYIEHSPNGARSNQDAVHILKMAHKIFTDLTAHVDSVVADHGVVAVRVTFSGVNTGTFFGVGPTHKKISWEAMEFFTLEHGVIAESWGSWPIYDMLKKLQA